VSVYDVTLHVSIKYITFVLLTTTPAGNTFDMKIIFSPVSQSAMKKFLLLTSMLASFFLIGGCHKDDPQMSGAPVSDETAAVSVLMAINNLWVTTLKPQLTVNPQIYSDTVIMDGPDGKVTVDGHYDYSRSSSSSSSSVTVDIDAIITFAQYNVNGLYLNGKLRFYDASHSRTACSSSGCASASNMIIAYASSDGSGNNFPPVTIAFKDQAGKQYRDNISITVSKEYAHWEGSLVNGKNQTISISY